MAEDANSTARAAGSGAGTAPVTLSPGAFVAVIFLFSRLWVALFVYLGHLSHPYLEPISGGWTGVANWWLNPWTTFDSQWYLRIAGQGYDPAATVFFPLYPWLLRLAGYDIIAQAAWGVLLSNGAFFGGLWYFYRLTALDYDDATARLATALLAFFPATVYFSAVYTESVFLLWVTACFYCVRRERWGWAALWALLAALTRNSGALLSVVLAWEAWRATRSLATRRHGFKPAIWGMAVAPVAGFAAVQLYFRAAGFGDLASVGSQNLFDRHLTWPWMPPLLDIERLLSGGQIHLGPLLDVGCVVLAFVLLWRHWKKQPLSYSLLVLGINLANLTYSRAFWPYSVATTRYMMTTFPFTQMLAVELRPLWNRRLARLILIAMYLLICAVLCWLFGRKSFNG